MSKTILVGMLGGAVAVAGTGGGAAYYIQHFSKPSAAEIHAAAAESARERYVRDEEINYATMISTVDRGRRDGGSMPVVVTFHLAGTRGLGEFCNQRPLVAEAVLRALEQDGLHAAVREAVNRVLDGGPVRGFSLQPMTDPSAGGRAESETERKCRELASAEKSNHT